MIFIQHYDSPPGGILLAADEIGLTGLWFDGQKHFARGLSAERIEKDTPDPVGDEALAGRLF